MKFNSNASQLFEVKTSPCKVSTWKSNFSVLSQVFESQLN